MVTIQENNFSIPRPAIMQHIGLRREQQDAVAFGSDYLILADGMGGQPQGARAGRLAAAGAENVLLRGPVKTRNADRIMQDCFRNADKFVAGLQNYDRHSPHIWDWPGSTLLVAFRTTDDELYLGSMGDSRGYIWDGEYLTQLTFDDADNFGFITRFVGMGIPDKYQGGLVNYRKGDRLMLATDGMFGPLEDDAIQFVFEQCEGLPASDICRQLTAGALAAGGRENITVAVWDL